MPDPQSSTSISAAAVGGPDFLRGPESLGSKEKVARVKLTQFKRFLLSSVGGSIPIFKDRGQIDRVPVSVSEWFLGSFVLILRRVPRPLQA